MIQIWIKVGKKFNVSIGSVGFLLSAATCELGNSDLRDKYKVTTLQAQFHALELLHYHYCQHVHKCISSDQFGDLKLLNHFCR